MIIEKMLKWLNENQWLNLTFLILSVLSILISYYLYYKSKKKRQPKYSIRSVNVLSNSIQKLGEIKVSYKNKTVESLTVTKVVIWNAGNDTLNFSDMTTIDRLRIEPSNGIEIFNAELTHQSNSTNNMHIISQDNIVDIQFDYLDQNQGGVIKIIHSGKMSSDLNIKGTFKNSGEIQGSNISNISSYHIESRLASLFPFMKHKDFVMGKSLPIILLITGFGVAFMALFFKDLLMLDTAVSAIIAGGLYVVLALIIWFKDPGTPTNFYKFLDD